MSDMDPRYTALLCQPCLPCLRRLSQPPAMAPGLRSLHARNGRYAEYYGGWVWVRRAMVRKFKCTLVVV
eukprot:COSAG02_NODE_7994_length_2755_cov_5.373117_4_plen_69_part_00